MPLPSSGNRSPNTSIRYTTLQAASTVEPMILSQIRTPRCIHNSTNPAGGTTTDAASTDHFDRSMNLTRSDRLHRRVQRFQKKILAPHHRLIHPKLLVDMIHPALQYPLPLR